MSGSNCCFLTYIQISQETGQVVCYSHLFKNFPQFVVIHTVKGFGIVNKAEVACCSPWGFKELDRTEWLNWTDWDVLLSLSCFFDGPMDVGNLISGSSAFSKSSLNIWNFMVHILLKPSLENFEHYFAAVAAKSLQSCLTMCEPIDGSPPGSPVPGILQARTLEWVAISFSNALKPDKIL